MGFKLLAIRPLEKCGVKFLKNLEMNRIYKFYDNYEFYNSQTRIDDLPKTEKYKIVDNIVEIEKLPVDFFSTKINISAIIGKNGSGKSSIIDLFIASINQISLKLRDDGFLNTTAELESTNKEKDNESIIHCEIFYQIDNTFFQIIINDNDFTFKTINIKGESEFDLKQFFYSEVISYSVYAFNSWEIGDWIDYLFHKNDSYQIPVVINPKRESKQDGWAGIININTESYLLQQRLLSIILSNPKFRITDNLPTEYLNLIFKNSKTFFALNDKQEGRQYEEEEEIKNDFYKLLNSEYGINFNMNNTRTPSTLYKNLKVVLKEFKTKYGIDKIEIPDFQYKIDLYILYKIISICEKYVSYNQFIIEQDKQRITFYTIDIKAFLSKIENSQSHIIFKLKQIINFIKNYEKIWSKYITEDFINIKKLSEELNLKSDKNTPIIELLPPPIFQTKLFSKNKIDLLDRISSGERQLIHSISTILYHLTNLNSVERDSHLNKYNYVNIILDEIELYFHPEFQKLFIKRLIDEISKLRLRDIRGINILIISHSPFILSDIPKQNVLFLEQGKPVGLDRFKSTNTFAANISDLLSDSFFIGDGLIGEYAKSKISETIDWLNLAREEQLKNEKLQVNKFDKLSSKKENHKRVIEIIDEPIIKSKLIEMYSEIFGNDARREYLEKEKDRIIKEIEGLS
ncbi:hypothetical protein [Moheibacter lacus]|uniref:ATPase AAA-type core domain-containing protein n=1 Tax=Moheibacter lacus TaxID=2745851 RepID=A0A838ZTS1_9FLAO|nr:hypothetical protein [Moheibacter lacus]MBA5630394.1 hypothetical protein [Moheibacter lacus]